MTSSAKSWRERGGKLIHDADCHYWDRHVCTCGLLHYIMPRADELANLYEGDLYADMEKHAIIMDMLLQVKSTLEQLGE